MEVKFLRMFKRKFVVMVLGSEFMFLIIIMMKFRIRKFMFMW